MKMTKPYLIWKIVTEALYQYEQCNIDLGEARRIIRHRVGGVIGYMPDVNDMISRVDSMRLNFFIILCYSH